MKAFGFYAIAKISLTLGAVVFALIWCLYYSVNLVGRQYIRKTNLRTCCGRLPFGVGVNELTNVTSNVNGWLPVQDGGTWRSDTDIQPV